MSDTPASQVATVLDPPSPPSGQDQPPANPQPSGNQPPTEEPPAPLQISPSPASPAPPGGTEQQPGSPSSPPAAPPSQPPDGKGQQPAEGQPDLSTIEDLLTKHFPEPSDPKAVPDWKKWKASVANVVNENRSLAVELDQLKQGGQGDDALKQQLEQATTRLKELEPLESEVTELRAIKGIEDSPAFRERYDASRVQIQDNFTRLAQEAGISKEAAEAVLNSQSEIQAATALSKIENLDDAAKSILLPMASQFVQLTRERAAQLKPQDPAESLRQWQERSKQMEGANLNQIRERGAAAANEAIQALADDPMLRTEAGRQKVNAFRQRIENNEPITETDAYSLMLKGEFAEDWKEFGLSQHSRVKELEAEVAKLKGMRPGSQVPSPPAGQQTGGPTPVYTGSAPPEPEKPAPIAVPSR